MNKRAIILDLDNTIYPVPAIGEKLFAPVFKLIEDSGRHKDDLDKIKADTMRIPFQVVAKKYRMSKELTEQAVNTLKDLEYNEPIETFNDYIVIKQIPADKFLVTAGFKKMQESKIRAMNIEKDFKEIYIIDPEVSQKKKKDVFKEIMEQYDYKPEDVLIIGDDENSEITAALELEIDNVLYDKYHRLSTGIADITISDYNDLLKHF
jgi:putative hydrolase of the HAD superfamily